MSIPALDTTEDVEFSVSKLRITFDHNRRKHSLARVGLMEKKLFSQYRLAQLCRSKLSIMFEKVMNITSLVF